MGSGTFSNKWTPGNDGVRINITEIKKFFCSEYACMMVADAAGVSYKELIGWQYKIVLEPIAYMTYSGMYFYMTATKAALYDQMLNGDLRKKMPSLTHQNLPLAMFLEYADMKTISELELSVFRIYRRRQK